MSVDYYNGDIIPRKFSPLLSTICRPFFRRIYVCINLNVSQFLDTRRDLCYAQYKEGQCSSPSSSPLTKSSCCCTGGGMAWGTPCLPCPDMGGAEFQTLCPHGAGMTYSGDGEYYSIVLIRLSFNFTIISNNMTNFITYSFLF